MKQGKDAVMIQQHINSARGIESWIISGVEPVMTDALIELLIGVHINIHDYLDFRPFFIVPLTSKPASGQLFRNLYLLDVKRFPEDIEMFCVNGVFLRECLEKEIKIGENKRMLHMMDAIEHLLDNDFRGKLSDIHLKKGCLFIGVYGEDEIHASRGEQ